VNLGLQTALSTNVYASAAPGKAAASGVPGTGTFLSAYVSSLSDTSTSGSRSAVDNPAKVKTSAGTAAAGSVSLAKPMAAPKPATLPTNHATVTASIAIPAAPRSFLPVTLPDFSLAFPVQQDSSTAPESSSASSYPLAPLASTAEQSAAAMSAQNPTAGGVAEVVESSVGLLLSGESSSAGSTSLAGTAMPAPAVLSGPSNQSEETRNTLATEGAAAAVSLSSVNAAPFEDNATPLKPSIADFPLPVQVGGESIALPVAPVQENLNPSTQNVAADLSQSLTSKTPPNAGTERGSSTFVDFVQGSVTSENCAASVFVPSAPAPQTRREFPTTRLAAGDNPNTCKPPGAEVTKPLTDSQASQAIDCVSSELPSGVPSAAVFCVTTSESEAPLEHSTMTFAPAAATSSTAAGMAPGSGRENTNTCAALDRATGIVPNQAEAGDPIPASAGVEQALRKDLTTVATAHAAGPLVMPQPTATSDPGDTAVLLATSPSAPPSLKTNSGAAPPAADSPSPSSTPGEAPATVPASPVQIAQMVSHAAQSEMRIGLTTSAFGAIEVRTLVRANDVGLTIASEKGDLRAVLANEIPGLANRLQQQNLRLSQVNFHESSASSDNSPSGGNSQHRFFSQSARVRSSATDTEAEPSPVHGTTDNNRSRHAGLSVLA
jgi:hypothetical protein